MPRTKSNAKGSSADQSGIDPKDLAAFRAALESPDQAEHEEHREDIPEEQSEAEAIDTDEAITPDEEEAVEGDENPGHDEDAVTVIPVTTAPGKSRKDGQGNAGHLASVLAPASPSRIPGMDRMETTKDRRWPWAWTIIILLILTAASVAGLFVFNRTAKFTGAHVQLLFVADPKAVSGSQITYTVQYQNQEPVDLARAELTVEYPDGFTFISASRSPSNDFHNAWSLGTIRRGQAGEIKITGTLIGAIGTSRDFSATLTYRPLNFNSDFQQKAQTTITIASSTIGVKLDGPIRAAPGATASWTLTYTNTADHDLSGVQVSADIPTGLSVTKTNPAPSQGSSIWQIDHVPKDASGTITITGTVNGAIGDTLQLTGHVGLVTSTGVDPQDQANILIVLVNTGLSTSVAINGSTDPVTANPGDTLNYVIRVANHSDVEVAGVTLAVTLAGAGLDLTQLQNGDQAAVKNGQLTWTQKQIVGLADVKPGDEVTAHFSVPIKSLIPMATDADQNQHVAATVTVSAPGLSNTNSNGQNSTIISTTKIGTVFRLLAEARYYDEDGRVIGSGPLPPKVGQTTAYRVIWAVTNTTSDVSTMKVVATLPAGVFWTGQNIGRDAGDINFDPTARTVTWTLNKVPAGSGSQLPSLKAHFEVSITPTADQVGSVVVLTQTTSATGTDSYLGSVLNQNADSLTTALPTDATAKGQGQVAS
ncbi:MAG: DUF11 domain-containing protein [Candidatus Kerfeldbacteria bacterium]|nr:DUF11 domain-containing protein [Candidatus Kerfeldbacteria bacterium]